MKKINSFILIVTLSLTALIFAIGQETGRKLSTTLTGATEVPGPGDTDGSGKAKIRLNQGKGEVCFELSVSNIATATAAHIHEAPTGQAGPVVVTLSPPPTNGSSSACVSGVSEDLIKRIRQNPENFYVNVHNADFPDGAVRGQLSKKD
jgi:hypothetical protein